jgi:rare lipoprotein A
VEIEALVAKDGKKQIAHYYIQAGAFSSSSLANTLKNKIVKITPSPVFIEKKDQKFIVRVGPFAKKYISEALKNKLAKLGVSGAYSVLQ